MSDTAHTDIGVTLSGGGVRAIAFHCGVLRWIAENNRMENIAHISTVSGGSLFVGLMLTMNDLKWPTSEEYANVLHGKIKKIVCTFDLQNALLKMLFYPRNIKYLFSRANVLSQCIERMWIVKATLNQLPERPMWSINGTTAETGKRFRFKRNNCGDYEIGYASASEFKLADALAVSAAFPAGIGPLVLHSANFSWRKRENWTDTEHSAKECPPQHCRLHIYDGGVYDNLGLEPLFDIGTRKFKVKITHLVVSDAGQQLGKFFYNNPLNPFRIKRVFDILMDQSRSLRVRSIANHFISNDGAGVYLQIGSDPRVQVETRANTNVLGYSLLRDEQWLHQNQVSKASAFPTTLHRMAANDFDLIEQHGYEVAKFNGIMFSSSKFDYPVLT